jgi:23S rRNA pseudouridine1911/1915/1917 synthase
MEPSIDNADFQVLDSEDGFRVDAVLKARFSEIPWSRLRKIIETGKLSVDTNTVTDCAVRVHKDQQIQIRMNLPRPQSEQRLTSQQIAYVDQHVIVVKKPPFLNSIPFETGERGSLQELVRAWLNRTAKARGDRQTGDLGVVHRLDRETSGLLVFTRTLEAKRQLAQQMRVHSVERCYYALVHGRAQSGTQRSYFVANRGDGLRGSTRRESNGQLAVTHVKLLQELDGASLVECRLETGRTHQVRIHMSESGHPLLGERVYIRGYQGTVIKAPRVMLHAAVLGFVHPQTQQVIRLEEPMPQDMTEMLVKLGGKALS